MKKILFLPSWYPSQLDAFNGDFIQRHALAASLFCPIHVLYIVRDKDRIITENVRVEEHQTGNLTETIIYYASKDFPVGFIDRLLSMQRYDRIYKDYLSKAFVQNISAAHVHVPYKAGLIALWLKKKYGVDFYITEHWTGYDKASEDNFYSRPASFRYITKKILGKAKCVAPVSRDLAGKLLSITPGLKIKVIPNAVNEKLFYLNREVPQGFRFIHYVSSRKGQKNTEGIISVLAKLNESRQDWECIMYGPAEDKIKETVRRSGLGQKIKFTGEIAYDKVAEIVRSASAFISFSIYENQPCSILEALCCGVPVIAAAVGGIPEIITDRNGILVEPLEETQLLKAITTMMNNANGYDRAAIAAEATGQFSYQAVGKQLNLLYES